MCMVTPSYDSFSFLVVFEDGVRPRYPRTCERLRVLRGVADQG